MRGPTAADLQTTLARQVDTLARRVRAFTIADWAEPSARPGQTNADAVYDLIAALDRLAAGVELRDKPAQPTFENPRRPADLGLSLGLDSVGERLVEVLRPLDPGETVWGAERRYSARTAAALGLAQVVLHRWDVTGPGDRGPEPRAARLVLQGLFSSSDDSGANPIRLLLHLTGRQQLEGQPGWGGDGWTWEFPEESTSD